MLLLTALAQSRQLEGGILLLILQINLLLTKFQEPGSGGYKLFLRI